MKLVEIKPKSRPKPDYRLTGICPGGKVVHAKRGSAKPPDEAHMAAWGKERGALFVLRYMPSRKGWRALDIRTAQVFQQQNQRWATVTGAVRGKRIWPSPEAAIMYLTAIGANTQIEMF